MQHSTNTYDQAITALSQSPNSPSLQHRAVLALARAGSLDFALAEYARYGLDKVRAHADATLLEDIMALGGRLQKDLYLASSGAAAKAYAQKSADLYEAAFEQTGGYYSGINAATMALLAGMPEPQVTARARSILDRLPTPDKPDRGTLYFIEATRAEAHLLLGKTNAAKTALQLALDHDPLNYTAHASTLKQFRMILSARGESTDWLSVFSPPKPAHYAGHMFKLGNGDGALNPTAIDALSLGLSDFIQRHDIGFGYGALGAGSDILIAEALLEEGADLHVVLPVAPDIFTQHSVAPYGADWAARFEACLSQAASLDISSETGAWPDPQTDSFARHIAMGKSVMQSGYLDVDPVQLLIWDEKPGGAGTARGASDWKRSGRGQIILSYPGSRKTHKRRSGDITLHAALVRADSKAPSEFTNTQLAADAALTIQAADPTAQLGLHIDLSSDTALATARKLAEQTVPGGILMSEAAASILVLGHEDDYAAKYMGPIDNIRAFALKPKGQHKS